MNGLSLTKNINNSMFYSCLCSSYGGETYYVSTNSYLRMICANGCSSSQYHNAYLQVSHINQVAYLYKSFCSNTTFGSNSLYVYLGNQSIQQKNSSMNNANQISGIGIQTPSSFISLHCTFSNKNVITAFAFFFLLPHAQYQCRLHILFITTVHLNIESYVPKEQDQ